MYHVLIARSAEKQLKKLPPPAQRKIAAIIMSFAIEPRPYGSKKLSGTAHSYRVRIGNYRVIYDIYEREIVVSVLKIGHRRDIYREFLSGGQKLSHSTSRHFKEKISCITFNTRYLGVH